MKELKSKHELQAMILADLRMVRGCEGIRWITVYPVHGPGGGANWGAMNPGGGDYSLDAVQRALPEIISKWQKKFDLDVD